MSYITLDYYKTDYLGIDPDDDTALTRWISRASDMVDLLTDNIIEDFDDLDTLQQKSVKKATAIFTEYFVENGDTFTENPSSSEKVGTWSVSASSGAFKMLPAHGVQWLEQADLMRASIDTIRGNCETD